MLFPFASLRLAQNVRIIPDPPDSVLFVAKKNQGVWQAPHAGIIVGILAEPAPVETILARFIEGQERETAKTTLLLMMDAGLVEPVADEPSITATCRALDLRLHMVERERWAEGVTLMALDSELGRVVAESLSGLGVNLKAESRNCLAVVGDYLEPAVNRLAADCRKAGRALLMAKVGGGEVWVGPVFRPGGGPCHCCLAARLRQWRWLETQWPGAGLAGESNRLDAGRQAGVSIVALETAGWLLDDGRAAEGRIWTMDQSSGETAVHRLPVNPNCPECGGAGEAENRERRRPILRSSDLRGCGEEEIISRLQPQESEITGVIRQVRCLDDAWAKPVYRYAAEYPPAIPPTARRMERGLIQPSLASGRGQCRRAAYAACLAEAVERYSLQFRGDEQTVWGAFADLRGSAIHPDSAQLFSERQFETRAEWNARHTPDEAVPERFRETERIEWYEGREWLTGEKRLIPMALCFQYYRPPGSRPIGDADSNGCAAGATLEEAILSAALELIERDSLALWWYNGVERPAVDALALEDPQCRKIAEWLKADGWHVRLHEISSDLGFPVVAAIAEDTNGRWLRGSGAHLSLSGAARRALEEAYQLSGTAPRCSPAPRGLSAPVAPPWNEQREPREFDSAKWIDALSRKLAEKEMELTVFDLTRADIGFPVVRVAVPGLRHSRPRFAPGRLYDVPVDQGWLESPRREQEFPETAP